ncbi:MAG TPA: response regulator [Candidatus Limnocylindrales bacterium]|nr:response regulator [Candidatus Limnocylindrales bacterium]
MLNAVPFSGTPKLSLSGAKTQSSAQHPPPANFNGKKVLIVDDSQIILKTLSNRLRAEGYHVLPAADGSTAVSTVRQERPDLILLDINFPPDVAHGGGVAWDGFLVLNWVRRMDEAVNTPVIIITGEDPNKHKNRCVAAGVADFFQKPIDGDALVASMRSLLFPGALPTGQGTVSMGLKKVLFVDDENDWRFMATIYLKESGYEVLTASNGEEAALQAQSAKPDLILLDLHLAGESGLDVMKLLKQKTPHVPILLYTGREHDEETVKLMLRQGACGYLRKGTMGEMLHAIQSAIGAPS